MTFLLFKLQTIYCKYAILQQQKIWCAFSYFHVSFTKCPLDPHVVDKIDEEADQEEGKRKFHLTTAIQQQKETLKRLKEQTNWCFPCKNEEKKKEISHKSSQLNQVCRLVFQYISFFLSLCCPFLRLYLCCRSCPSTLTTKLKRSHGRAVTPTFADWIKKRITEEVRRWNSSLCKRDTVTQWDSFLWPNCTVDTHSQSYENAVVLECSPGVSWVSSFSSFRHQISFPSLTVTDDSKREMRVKEDDDA